MKIVSYPPPLRIINQGLNGKISEEYGIYNLEVDNFLGLGNVKCIELDKAITALDIRVNLKKEVSIQLKSAREDVVFFIFCSSGEVYFDSGNSNPKLIENLKSSIAIANKDSQRELRLVPGEEITLNILVVDKDKYFSKFLNGYYHSDIRLEKLLEALDNIGDLLSVGTYNYKINEQIRLLNKKRTNLGISEFLYLEGIYHLILAYHIEQFYDDIQRDGRTTSLTDSELKVIGEVGEHIVESPELQHNINDLCRRAGMSPAKLQEGFKHLFGKTVLNYIRHVRLQKAETLLLNSDYNISEVVYSIGFTSRSYFCKIFKNKFNCTPKEFKRNMQKKIKQSKQVA